MSLTERIKSYAMRHPNTWIHGGHYQRLSMEAGYMPSNCDRRMRELSMGDHPFLEKRERPDGTMEYRYPGLQIEPQKDTDKPKVLVPNTLFQLAPKSSIELNYSPKKTYLYESY